MRTGSTEGAVQFLHQTVKEYLALPDTLISLDAVSAAEFDPSLALLSLHVSLLKDFHVGTRTFINGELGQWRQLIQEG